MSLVGLYDRTISANSIKALGTYRKQMLVYGLDRSVCLTYASNLLLVSTQDRTHAAALQIALDLVI